MTHTRLGGGLRVFGFGADSRKLVLEGEILLGNPVLVAHGHQALHQVLELSDIARPVILLERLHRAIGDPLDLLPKFCSVAP